MESDQSLDWLISVDDHVLEPPHLWVDRMPAKDHDRAPHMVVEGDMEFWVYDGKRFPSSGLSAVAGKSKEEFSPGTGDLRGDATRVLRRQGADRGHEPGRNIGLAVLPDGHPVLWAALHGRE